MRKPINVVVAPEHEPRDHHPGEGGGGGGSPRTSGEGHGHHRIDEIGF